MNRNHPAVDYVNLVNRRIYDDAAEVSKNAQFLIAEDEDGTLGFLVSSFSLEDLQQWNQSQKFFLRSEISAEKINAMIKDMAESGINNRIAQEVTRDGIPNGNRFSGSLSLKESQNMMISSCIMYFLGFDDIAKSLLETAFYNEEMKLGQLKFIHYGSSVVSNYKQSLRSSKPRNPHYAEAMRIAALTWEKYPAASKKSMCVNLRNHFNGQVSIDTLNDWIKKQKIQPPKPKAYTSFSLVLSPDA
ncbi:hypothetical protein [Rahnella sp. ChDrAdgB13]|uniref:hypothetical protein n=1 Tax=Rahnella sp. ChDrAdgB13 TaxID=1850581 RepID=UPI001AD89255|nr:hypothetical protein [Rahnella sp. ChDrAdgB13]